MSRRHIYDRLREEAREGVQAEVAAGSLDDVLARVNAWLTALRDEGVHVGVAVGDGPHLCVACGHRWPCAKTRAEVPSLR